MQTLDENLFSSFEPASTHDWEAQILTALKGAEYEKKLVTTTSDGLRRKPYYRAEDLPSWMHNGDTGLVKRKGRSKTFKIRQDFFVSDPNETNTLLLTALKDDLAEFGLQFANIPSPSDLEKLLKGVWLDAVPIHLNNVDTQMFLEALRVLGYEPSQLKGTWTGAKSVQTGSISDFPFTGFRTTKLDGHTAREHGATPVLELAILLGQLSDALSVGTPPDKIFLHTGIGSDYFSEIAKLRALHRLIPQVFDAYQLPNHEIPTTAFSLVRNKTTRDRHSNLLRMTTESMSAIFGGVDSVSLPRFDFFHPEESTFSLRLSRNILHLLRHESHLNRVQDPAAGSYYIEKLTESLAELAWGLLQEIEAKGGYKEATDLVSNWIQTANKKELADVATGKRVLLGTNTFPNLIETPVSELVGENGLTWLYDRYREEATNQNKKLRFSLVRFGPSAMATVRGVFASNMVGCAPFPVIESPLLPDKTAAIAYVTELAKEQKGEVTDFVVLCSADDEYDAFSPDEIETLKANACLVLMAGKSTKESEYLAQGVEFIRLGRGGLPESVIQTDTGTAMLNLSEAVGRWTTSF
ncbi:MAG: hypothetical protein J0L94_03945 [Rhodothermia bacterium]|nr:hypothetical protein [Rhodothermia bacterium]